MKVVEGFAFEVVADGLGFPEGPVWLQNGSVIVVEVAAGTITRVHADGRTELVVECGGGPGGAAVGPDGALYVCNNGGMVAHREDGRWKTTGVALPDYEGGWIDRIDLATGAVGRLYSDSPDIPIAGPNDIVFDAHGGFWFSDFGKPVGESVRKGGILYASPDGSGIRRVIDGPRVNGIALSPSGETLYAAITHESLLVAFDVVSPGVLEPAGLPAGRPVGQFPPRHILDSMAVESDGRVCVATTFAQPGIGVVDPVTGGISLTELPDPLPTNLCFGGPDMRDVWITLSGEGLLIKARWPRAGLPLAYYA
ncbi:SMP-30/gluconolactonase/LRE family protein [Glaciibacter sp. 2TAF33]|uniref:SMP-30/gluconolactonase/LRE family protein n=1 Tax=Glaciibacter sp. 2TAF33 TaxID=3233015 RepID=UPI003F93A8C3